jgi:hypothetical protein
VVSSDECRTQLLRHALAAAKRPLPPDQEKENTSNTVVSGKKFPVGVKFLRAKRPAAESVAVTVDGAAAAPQTASMKRKPSSDADNVTLAFFFIFFCMY